MESGLRVLVVSDELHRGGGAPLAQLAVGRGLAERGHIVELRYLRRGPLLEDWRTFAKSARRLLQREEPPLSGSTRSWVLRASARAVNRTVTTVAGTLERSAGETVVLGNGHADVQAASEIAHRLRCPLVLHLHSPPWRLDRLGTTRRRAMLSAARYVAVSEALRSAWTDAGIPEERTVVVHNGVDADSWPMVSADTRRRAREALGIDADAFVYLYGGRVVPAKGVDILMSAMAGPGLDDAVVVVAGASPPAETSHFERQIASALPPERLTMVHSTKAMVGLYHAADAVVVPSIYPDPFPLTILEAMAVGVPVVTTRTGGCTEGLAPELLPYVAEPGDVDSLQSSLLEIRTAIEDGVPLGRAARAHVEAKFSVDRMIDGFERCFEDVLT